MQEYYRLAEYLRTDFANLGISDEAVEKYLGTNEMKLYKAIMNDEEPPFSLSRMGRIYDEVDRLRERNIALRDRVAKLREKNADLKRKNAELTQRIDRINSKLPFRIYHKCRRIWGKIFSRN
jgi:predicted RNase H-like nuclease (RuvC/YqgF family)